MQTLEIIGTSEHANASSQSSIAFSVPQRVASQVQSNHTRRACSVDAVGRAAKLKEMVYSPRLECSNGTWNIVCSYLLRRVDLSVLVARLPIERANTLELCGRRAVWYIAGHLQGFVCRDQAKTLSRISLSGLARGEAEETRIKCTGLVKEASERLLRKMCLGIESVGWNLSLFRRVNSLAVCWTYHFMSIKALL